MHERHEGMEPIGKSDKSLHRELDRARPTWRPSGRPRRKIADLVGRASNWFPAGTGPNVGKTGAKPAIWQHPDDFTAKLTAFQRAAKASRAAAAGDDVAAPRPPMATSARPARRATTPTARRCTTELDASPAAGLGCPDPPRPWLLAG